MASIIKRTEEVLAACEKALLDIRLMRKAAQEQLIDRKMQETKPGLAGKVPKYATREAAIEALKDEHDFFGNRLHTAETLGWETVSDLELLRAMCKCAGVIRLDAKDFRLVRHHLVRAV